MGYNVCNVIKDLNTIRELRRTMQHYDKTPSELRNILGADLYDDTEEMLDRIEQFLLNMEVK